MRFEIGSVYTITADVTKTGNGERGAGNGERKSGNELSAETSTKIKNGGPKSVTIFHGRRGRVSFRYSIN